MHLNGEANIDAPRGKCALRSAVSAVIVGDGALDVPLSKANAHLRYLKIKQSLLPNVKNAAIGGIIKEG